MNRQLPRKVRYTHAWAVFMGGEQDQRIARATVGRNSRLEDEKPYSL
jgi:hypothetical protein